MSSLKILSIIFLVACVFGEQEESLYSPSSIDADGDGEPAVEFAHESILGSHQLASEFHTLDEEEARKRLEDILTQMDTDSDKSISLDELSAWIVNSMKKLDEEEASEGFMQTDTDKDGAVTWEEYLKAAFNTDKEKLAALEAQNPQEGAEFKKQVAEEEGKYKTADADGDERLSLSEFAAILNPYHFEHMAALEIEHVRKQYDADADGFISKQEYLGFGSESRTDKDSAEYKEQQQSLSEQFDSFDADHSGALDAHEIREWVAPGVEGVARQEAETMLAQTDANQDGKLSFDEILARTNQWVGSRASGEHHHTHHHHHEHEHEHDDEYEHHHDHHEDEDVPLRQEL